MTNPPRQHVLITGVSTGIGYDAARYLIARGFYVFGSVRTQADAERVRASLGERFTPLLFDVTDAGAIKAAVSEVAAAVGFGAAETMRRAFLRRLGVGPAAYRERFTAA